MNLAAEKRELIKWINSLENPFIIAELNKIRKRENFKFEKEWERGARRGNKKNTTDFLKT
ncbi:hypothetical protein [uncultured Chryseobacterium sp.]|uniref:hypothetical protein n=1 Tax=uncultured Chryseobacterium sp. TaxID=259322 RepID=UPI0025CC9D60|nr:hypothetical protein [uncultured Chryseobacterium sp.]